MPKQTKPWVSRLLALRSVDPIMDTRSFGLEREYLEEADRIAASTLSGVERRGALMPLDVEFEQRAVDSATSTTGGPFKFTQAGTLIELMRNKSSVMRAGATVISGLQGPRTAPRQTGGGTVSWRAENPGSDLSRTDLTTNSVSLALKTIQSSTSVSRQNLIAAASGNFDLEMVIRNDLAAVIALGIDLGGLNGTGASNQPTGVLQDTSVGTATALGTNGGTMAWSNWVEMEYVAQNANAAVERTGAFVINPKVARNARKTEKAAGSGFCLGDDNRIASYPTIVSNQVPSNLTKGTSTTVCSAVVFGAWDQLLIGMFGNGFDIIVDPYTLKHQGLVDITAFTFCDIAIAQPTAFVTLKDVTTP